jgi:hypothetical protein
MKLTLESILARCIEDGDCLLWPGAKSGDGSPCASFGAPRYTVRLRRWVWAESKGPLPADRNVTMNGPKGCGHALCLNVAHMLPVTKREQMRLASALGKLQVRPGRVAHQQQLKRATAKLDLDKARQIRFRRAAGETLTALAAEFGVHHSLIDRIAKNLAWRELATNASVFTWNGSLDKHPLDAAMQRNREQTRERTRARRAAANTEPQPQAA